MVCNHQTDDSTNLPKPSERGNWPRAIGKGTHPQGRHHGKIQAIWWQIITCGTCHKETKLSRVKLLFETIDATTKCSGCNKNLPVKSWQCACNKPWHQCEKHCRAGEVFRRLSCNKAKQKREDAELGRDPKRMQKQTKRELNALQRGIEPSANNRTETVTMRPKYNNVFSVGVNPNFLSLNLKRRFGF